MKKTLSILLAIIMIFSMFALGGITSSASNPSGSCGEGVLWSYSHENKTLTIAGSGYMMNYLYDNGTYNRPWEAYQLEIEKVVIEYGVLSVGDFAFIGCNNIKNIQIAETIIAIGESAFQSCVNLRYMDIGRGVIAVGPSAFKACINLTTIKLSKNTLYIFDNAFFGCPISHTIYTGTTEQEKLILFEDPEEKLNNIIYADTDYDVFAPIGGYQLITTMAIEPFEFVMANDHIIQLLEPQYGTYIEDGVKYYIGYVKVMGIYHGTTTFYAVNSTGNIIGTFSALSGDGCIHGQHRFAESHQEKNSTCVEQGFQIAKCESCGHNEIRMTDFADHRVDYQVDTEATCQTPGLERGICGICKEELEREIPITDHNWTDWVVTVAPTEETEGERERKCTMCETVEKEIIPALSTVIGDANGDGKVTAMDARWVLQHAAEMRVLDEHHFKLADVNNDGKVSAIDARKILQIAAGLI